MRVTLVLFTVLCSISQTIHADTLLNVLNKTSDLSTFSSLIQKTGGGIPNPAFEERFNSALDTRNYTAFVPIDSVTPLTFLDETIKLILTRYFNQFQPQSWPLSLFLRITNYSSLSFIPISPRDFLHPLTSKPIHP
jgi:hypothetical protein